LHIAYIYFTVFSLSLVCNAIIYPPEMKGAKLSSSTSSAQWRELILFANISDVTPLKLHGAGSVTLIPNTIHGSENFDVRRKITQHMFSVMKLSILCTVLYVLLQVNPNFPHPPVHRFACLCLSAVSIKVLTYLLTELSPSCGATQELPSILWNPKV
jgi:hypothetical protein